MSGHGENCGWPMGPKSSCAGRILQIQRHTSILTPCPSHARLTGSWRAQGLPAIPIAGSTAPTANRFSGPAPQGKLHTLCNPHAISHGVWRVQFMVTAWPEDALPEDICSSFPEQMSRECTADRYWTDNRRVTCRPRKTANSCRRHPPNTSAISGGPPSPASCQRGVCVFSYQLNSIQRRALWPSMFFP